MARGYPSPKQPAADAMPMLVPEGTCVICKRREAAAGGEKCARCTELLSG